MFRQSPAHLQTSLLGYYNQLPESKRKLIEQSAQAAFHKQVVSRIDETPFAPLYCEQNGRPNQPVRKLLGAIVLMHMKGWTVAELFENISFNLLTMRALGVETLEEQPFCRATFFNFQDRLARHFLSTGQNLLEQIFDHLSSSQLDKLGIRGQIQRSDSFQAISNIACYSRLRLLIEVLIRLYRALSAEDKERFGEMLGPYISDSSGHYTYGLQQSELAEELRKLGEVYARLRDALKDDYAEGEIFHIFRRTFQDHFTFTEQRIELRPKAQLATDSLQAPDDPDATYRPKNGKDCRGQVVSITETADPDDEVNLITDVAVAPNNQDDSRILEGRLEKMKQKTPALAELHTDGAYASEDNDRQMEQMGICHVVTGMRGRPRLVEFDIKQHEDGYSVSCPHQTVRAQMAKKRWKASFDPQTCQGCPKSESCSTTEQKRCRAYYFTHSDYLIQKRRDSLAKIPPERRKVRANVEATVKQFTKPFNHKGKLRYRGRFRTELYALSMAIAINFGRELRNERRRAAAQVREATRDTAIRRAQLAQGLKAAQMLAKLSLIYRLAWQGEYFARFSETSRRRRTGPKRPQ
ncbi:transposase [bacterium]|nr:transposase [bacterium]